MRKFCLVKSRIFKTQQLVFVLESRIPRSIQFHDLYGIAVYIVDVRNRILILIGSESWTRKECELLLPKDALFQHCTQFLGQNDE